MGDTMTEPHNHEPAGSRELKPCPFCGGRANVYVYTNEVDFVTKWSVGCGDCSCDMDVCEDTPADAAVEWNTRAPAQAEQERIAELQYEAGMECIESTLALSRPKQP